MMRRGFARAACLAALLGAFSLTAAAQASGATKVLSANDSTGAALAADAATANVTLVGGNGGSSITLTGSRFSSRIC